MSEGHEADRGLTHFDEKGRGKMVDITEKPETEREAIATGKIYMSREAIEKLRKVELKKGDAIAVANVAGIMGAKMTPQLIPMTHNISLTSVSLEFFIKEDHVEVVTKVKCTAKTGAEMEALTACSVALLTIYDMCKAVDKRMVISDIHLVMKKGGKSGEFVF